jgi:hypothetical protein
VKRIIVLVLIGSLATAAFLLPEPDVELAPVVTTSVPDSEPAIQAFALCPWATTEGSLEALMAVLATGDASGTITFPSAGEVRETRQVTLEGLSGVTFDLGAMPFEGQMPSVVEVTTDASVGVLVHDELMLAGAGCASSVPKIWLLPGGSTRPGDTLQLQLFNPFPEDARVTVVMTNESDFEPEPSLEAITVNARSWRTIDIATLLPLRESLSATIEVEKGVVIPAFLQVGPDDQALWTGVERADRWEFPLVAANGLEAALVLSNPTSLEVSYAVDRFGIRTSESSMVEGTIEPGKHVRIRLSELFDEPSGLQVRAEGLLGAVIVGESEHARAATSGAHTLASSWLVPGLGSVRGADSDLWILNTSAQQVTVTWATLDPSGRDRSGKVAVEAGTMRRVNLPVAEASGVFVQATAPITVGASMAVGDAVAYLSPVPLPEER